MNSAEPDPETKAPDPKPEVKVTDPKPESEGKAPDPRPEGSAPDPKPKAEAKAPDAKPSVEDKASDPKAGTDPKAPGSVTKPDSKDAGKTPAPPAGKPRSEYRTKIIIGLAALGVLAAITAAYLFGIERKAQPPVFKPVSSPYDSAIYANGIVESDQPSGSNINIYPDVSGAVIQVLAHEGMEVVAGAPLLSIDDSVQKATTEQLRLQADASLALLDELKAQPRKETLAIAESQVGLAESVSKSASDQYAKDRASYEIDPRSISKDVLDTAEDALKQATAGLDVAQRQLELTKAGAWSYDVTAQERQSQALRQAYDAANALLQKFTLRAPVDGVVLAVSAAVGGYVSAQGNYNPYTEGFEPLVTMGTHQDHLAVRCFVDEILISRLPSKWHIVAQMAITGTDIKVPLEFVRVQPYVSPKIELSNERQERVDLRVLPVIFRFERKDVPVYPGQLVDVYIGKQ
jgi:HlyD family secretion protein